MGSFPDLMFVLVLCLAMGIALSFFFCYHLSLIYKNQTTNEMNKISDMQYHLENELEEHSKKLHDLGTRDGIEKEAAVLKKNIEDTQKKIEKLKENPYDRGFRNNVMEVLCPK